jgi:ribosome recycling factor
MRDAESEAAMEFDFDKMEKRVKKVLTKFEKELESIRLASRLSPEMVSEIYV